MHEKLSPSLQTGCTSRPRYLTYLGRQFHLSMISRYNYYDEYRFADVD